MTNPETKTKNTKNQISIILFSIIGVVIFGLLLTFFLGWYYLIPHISKSRSFESSSTQSTQPIRTSNFGRITNNLPNGLTQIELAKTTAEHSQGLMNRIRLCATCGMLFIYPTPDLRTFWMKDTLVPLDIIFLDSDFRVINISSDTKTNQTDEVYNSSQPAQYILEVPANWSKNQSLSKDSKIDFDTVKSEF
ncbi:MAG: DUF192 domain-containing protein [Candidatus Parcubacteria bacterium]|nr:DUF192 domain-containing protein [Candidatus Paceibacterota bacterium]